jgi:hypothetical protein
MRKFLITVLLASAVVSPALAGPRQDRSDRKSESSESSSEASSSPRGERSGRSERSERHSAPRESSFVASERPARQQSSERVQRIEQRNAERESLRADRQSFNAERSDAIRQRVEQVREDRSLRQHDRPLPRVMQTRVPVVSTTPREGTQPPLRTESRPMTAPQWSTSWRHSDRYDWQNHRRRHRSLFHLGFYFDPFGWGYSPYQIGWRMWPSYYTSRYWLNDPWQYRLPYAPPGYRWVRYWDDAVLVDTWSGEVVDVIYNFFW